MSQQVVKVVYRELLRRTRNTDYAKTLQAVTRRYMHETDPRIIDHQIQVAFNSLAQTNQIWFKRIKTVPTKEEFSNHLDQVLVNV